MKSNNPYEHMTVEIAIYDGDEIVAKCSATDHCIHDLQVHTDYQRRGYAKKMIGALERNFDANWLWVKADNMEAVSLYNNLGFKIIEIDDGYYKMKVEIDDQE